MSTPRQIQTSARQGKGSADARRQRAAGRVPVNVYGHGQANVERLIDAHELHMAFHTTDQVFMLQIDGRPESCLVKQVQYDTYGQHIVHVDFARIDLSEEVAVVVALEFRGDPQGVRDGGVPIIHHPSLAVRCRADSIPDHVTVDVSAVVIGHALHAADIALPEGVKLDLGHIRADEAVFSVALKKVEAAPVETAAAPAEGEAAPAAGDAKGEKAEGKPDAKGGDAKGDAKPEAKGKGK